MTGVQTCALPIYGIAAVKSGTKAMAFGNILFGGIIGAAVDTSTGAAYDYPDLITIVMGKTSMLGGAVDPKASADKAAAAATPSAAPAAPATMAAPVDAKAAEPKK